MQPARVLWIDPDFRRVSKAAKICCVCGKALRPSVGRLVRLLDGHHVLHPDDRATFEFGDEARDQDGRSLTFERDDGDQWIGPDCAKRLGLEWSWPP